MGETTNTNYTDSTFAGERRRFYSIFASNPFSTNSSIDYFGVHVYTLEHNSNTQNWIGFPTNFSYLSNANETLNEITNATAITLFNETIQGRVTCNPFSCPEDFACTDTNCNFGIENGRGYEVNINSSAPSEINWSGVGIVNSKATINLVKPGSLFGKNWISIYANTSLINARNILDNIPNSDATTNWREDLQTSEGLIKTGWSWMPYLGTNFVLEMEKGYEVLITQNTTWEQI